jgi:hypothetical protein
MLLQVISWMTATVQRTGQWSRGNYFMPAFAWLRFSKLRWMVSCNHRQQQATGRCPCPSQQLQRPLKSIPAGAISAEDAAKHLDEQVMVCGRVYGGKYLSSGSDVTFINMGVPYPNAPESFPINRSA